ncbi:DUF1127 domain-containing protein [Mongoliimonas terrestris]|nr:DUF1127 domain-containing protein [Mongoliimonas terrestris]
MKTVRTVIKYIRRQIAANHLAEMDDRLLKDIGISRGEIERAVRSGR